jgi:hypothetical protein
MEIVEHGQAAGCEAAGTKQTLLSDSFVDPPRDGLLGHLSEQPPHALEAGTR